MLGDAMWSDAISGKAWVVPDLRRWLRWCREGRGTVRFGVVERASVRKRQAERSLARHGMGSFQIYHAPSGYAALSAARLRRVVFGAVGRCRAWVVSDLHRKVVPRREWSSMVTHCWVGCSTVRHCRVL